MTVYGKIVMTLAIGTMIAFLSPAGVASAQDGTGAAAMTGAAGAADHDGDGVPNCQDPDWTGSVGPGSGSASQHQNRWNHRNTEQNRYGEMGQAAGAGQGRGFVDENGDGINDLARDSDGDGIPNGKDPDWVRNKRDGTGNRQGSLLSTGSRRCAGSQNRGNKGSQ